jgi:tripartite-type tricarboxylate transporter receptor subunit TctC
MQRRTILAGALAAATLPAFGQEWPARTIKWIVPYAPGTAPDTTVRVVAEAMGDALRQTVIVENKAGAGGNIGAQLAARAPADGYTWVYSASPMAAAMAMHRKPGFDAMKDFVHVSTIGASDVLLVVHPESGVRSVRDLIERARREPGRLNFSSGGVGTPAHLGVELMLAAAGVEATHVPFKGAVDAVQAVMTRQVDFCLPIFQVALAHVQQKRLVALGVAGPRRNAKLPDVPTLEEAGLKGVSLVSFGGLSVPAGTPAPIVSKLNATVRKVLDRPDVQQKLDFGGRLEASSPEAYTDELRAEIARTERMMKAAKLEPQQ